MEKIANVAERREPSTDAASSRELRLDRLLEGVAARSLDAALITSDESIAYLTGFKPMQLERLFGIVVGPERPAVIVPALDLGQLEGVPPRLSQLSYGPESDGIPELTSALAGARTVGVEEDHLIYARARTLEQQGFELVPAGSVVMGLRIQKDVQEIERIRSACELVQEGLRRAFEWLAVGVVEHALNARVEGWLRERGASEAHPLILFGENAANPHAQPGPRELRRGDVVCADMSACLDGCPARARAAGRGLGPHDRAWHHQSRGRRDQARGRHRGPAGRAGGPLDDAARARDGERLIRSVPYLQPRAGRPVR